MIFTRWDVQQQFIDEINKIESLKIKNVLIWNKVIHGMGDLKRAYGSKYESIIYATKKGFKFPNKRPTDILEFKRVNANKLIHPNEKPTELLEKLIIDTTVEKEVVLDLFMGSGSTGVAAKNLNRNFIGIELDENYFNIAKERIHKISG